MFCVFVTCLSFSQGYTLAEEEEDPLIFQHRQLRSNQSDTLVSGPVESGPMKKLHVSTTALQKVCIFSLHTHIFQHSSLFLWLTFTSATNGLVSEERRHNYVVTIMMKIYQLWLCHRKSDYNWYDMRNHKIYFLLLVLCVIEWAAIHCIFKSWNQVKPQGDL